MNKWGKNPAGNRKDQSALRAKWVKGEGNRNGLWGMIGKKAAAYICCAAILAMPVLASNEAVSDSQTSIEIKGKSAILAEASTGKILYEYNAHDKTAPASIAKIMTELLVLEALESGRISWDDQISCSEHAASMGGSDIWLKPGEVMSAHQLFEAMAVSSANDAAVLLAETVAGSESAFVEMMNEKARVLGMNDTRFANATGLDDDNNYTSAYDVMLMSKELIAHKDIFNYTTIWMDTLRDGKTNLYNTNKLIHSYSGCNGLKTGSTDKAGYCLSATALRKGMQLITVVMNCSNINDRFSSASNMLDYGFANYSVVSPEIEDSSISVKVLHGSSDTVEAIPAETPSILVNKGQDDEITQTVSVVSDVSAPVIEGQVLGEITFWIDEEQVGSVPLIAENAVDKLTFGGAFLKIFEGMLGA